MPGLTVYTGAHPVQVWIEPALGNVVGMRDIGSGTWAFTAYFTPAGHK